MRIIYAKQTSVVTLNFKLFSIVVLDRLKVEQRVNGFCFHSIVQRGSEHGDEITPEGFLTNHAGGVLGGISTGQPITVSLAIKPTSSIRVERRSIDRAGNPVSVQTLGRHDPCVGIRATPIAESLLAIILADHALRHRAQCGDGFVPS